MHVNTKVISFRYHDTVLSCLSRPSQGIWGTVAFFFSGTWEQRPKNKGNRGTQAILGNIENPDFVLGEQGHFFLKEQGNRYALGGPLNRNSPVIGNHCQTLQHIPGRVGDSRAIVGDIDFSNFPQLCTYRITGDQSAIPMVAII